MNNPYKVFKTYVGGFDNIAHDIKEIYIPVNGKAKKVYHGFIGVNDKAKLFYKGYLPTLDFYIFPKAEGEAFMNTFIPPTLDQIFASWHRFSNNGAYYPAGTTPEGEAASWEMVGTDYFRCTVNSSYWTGFLSPEAYDNYEHEATLGVFDTTGDNDGIGIVLAFSRIGNINHALIAVRSAGRVTGELLYDNGNKGWAIIYSKNNSSWQPLTTTPVNDDTTMNSWYIASPPDDLCNALNPVNTVGATSNQWRTKSPTKVYVKRSDNIFTCKTTQFMSTNWWPSSEISFDINTIPALKRVFTGKCSYGYTCLSQQSSSFKDVKFSGGLDANTVCIQNNDNSISTYTWTGNSWQLQSSTSLQSLVGYPRIIRNPTNNELYEVEKNSVIKLT